MRLLLLCVLVLAGWMSFAQEDDIGLTLVSVERADEIGFLQTMILAPDGTMLAWLDGREDAMCIYTFENEETDCTPIPDSLFDVLHMVWSPDGEHIAFTEDFSRRLYESDIWLFDVVARTFIHRTDDGQEAGIFEVEGAPIDYMPRWNPATGDLYFFRSQDEGAEEIPTDLYRIPTDQLTATGIFAQPEILRRFFDFGTFGVFDTTDTSLDSAASVSPDGTQIAIIVRPNNRDIPQRVFIYDIENDDLSRLVSAADLSAEGMPEWLEEPLMLNGLTWTADGEGVIVSLFDPRFMSGITANVYYVNVDDATITPLLDFSDYPDEESVFTDTNELGYPLRYDLPTYSVYLPEDELFIYFNYDGENAGLSAVSLSAPDEIIRLGEFEYLGRGMSNTSIGDDGETVRILLINHLITLRRS